MIAIKKEGEIKVHTLPPIPRTDRMQMFYRHADDI